MRCRHQSADIDPRAGTKINTALVGQKHLAIGGHPAENLRSTCASYPVQRNGAGRGLAEIDPGIGANIEAVPVNCGAIGALLDHHLPACRRADLRRSRRHLPVDRKRIRRRLCCRRTGRGQSCRECCRQSAIATILPPLLARPWCLSPACASNLGNDDDMLKGVAPDDSEKSVHLSP